MKERVKKTKSSEKICRTIGTEVLIYWNPNFLNLSTSNKILVPSNISFFKLVFSIKTICIIYIVTN